MVNCTDEVEEVKRRGRTKLINVWNIPRGHRIVVNCNELNQPIGEEAGVLAKFLGMVARNGSLCSLSFKDWRLLIGKKDMNNKQINKEVILNQVKDLSETNRINCTRRKAMHTSGTKSFARNREDLRENDPEKKYPHRAILYIHTHKSNISKNRNAHVVHKLQKYGELKALLAQQPDLADTSNGKVAWEGYALNKILGAEKPGHVHGLGLVPNPKQVFDTSTSRSMKNLNVTTLDETSSEDVVALRLELEKLQNRVQKQDDTILDLQHALEQQKVQHGCVDAPLSAPKDVHNTMKRKQIYCQLRNEDSSMLDELNNTMSNPPQPRREGLQATISASLKQKNNSNASKVMNQDMTQKSYNHAPNKNQDSIEVFLKSTRHPNKKVALGRVLSQDPKTKVGDVALGKEFWMVRVSLVSVRDEPLIRPYNNLKF
ncbi:hypothetical protein ZEAMMB73_Zm00001d030809 [Zea mays]|uniref:Transposase Tnp1/En/Spm-like domain-containing protein n=1 Tax=Zea mays TaxID=4577 RepID=A0A1D6KEJ5_MAIZE|nr:hypothetical protein ZEAMMB73_Zm00001d030809 [Zea mays]